MPHCGHTPTKSLFLSHLAARLFLDIGEQLIGQTLEHNAGIDRRLLDRIPQLGGLRDRELASRAKTHCHIDAEVEAVIPGT